MKKPGRWRFHSETQSVLPSQLQSRCRPRCRANLSKPFIYKEFSSLTTKATEKSKKKVKIVKSQTGRCSRFSEARCRTSLPTLTPCLAFSISRRYRMTQNTATVKNTRPNPAGSFYMRMGNTTYVIGVHFSQTSKDTLEDKMKRLMRDDVRTDNF